MLCVVGLLRSVGNPIGSLLMGKRGSISALNSTYSKPFCLFGDCYWWADGGRNRRHAWLPAVQIINTILSYFVMIKPVLGSVIASTS